MNSTSPERLPLALVALVAVLITVLVCLGHPIPDVLSTIALVALGVSGGVTAPKLLTSSNAVLAQTVTPLPAPAAAPPVPGLPAAPPAVGGTP